MHSLKISEVQIKVKVKRMYKIQICSVPIYPSTFLEMEREGESQIVKRVRKERKRGGVG